LIGFRLGDEEEGTTKLVEHFKTLIHRIADGSWKHLPRTSILRKNLRDKKLVDWKFKQTDISDHAIFRQYDQDVKALWPTSTSLTSVVGGLREKVIISRFLDISILSCCKILTNFRGVAYNYKFLESYSLASIPEDSDTPEYVFPYVQ